MGKLRVYELAKEVKMSSNELVERLKSAGFSINNYMSSLDMDDVSRAKDYLSGATDEILEEKRIKPTIIRRRKKMTQDYSCKDNKKGRCSTTCKEASGAGNHNTVT